MGPRGHEDGSCEQRREEAHGYDLSAIFVISDFVCFGLCVLCVHV